MLGAAKVYARHNQATVISPFILAGAMSPVTVAGTSAQILAEALAGMAFVQLVRPGAPVVFGTFAQLDIDAIRRTHLRHPGTSLTAVRDRAALARRLGVPFRSGGGLVRIQDSRCPGRLRVGQYPADAAMLAGVNFMLHTAGLAGRRPGHGL